MIAAAIFKEVSAVARELGVTRTRRLTESKSINSKLRSTRIGYVHLRKLGGLRHARRDSRTWAAKQKKSALMCAEAVPWRCHRSTHR